AHRHRHRLHAPPLLGPVRGGRQAALRRRSALRPSGQLGDRPAASRAGQRMCARDPPRGADPGRQALSRCGAGGPGLAWRGSLHPDHLAPSRRLRRRHRAVAGRHRAALRPAALLRRQGPALRRTGHRPPGRRFARQPRGRARPRHRRRDAPAPMERRLLRVRGGRLRRGLARAGRPDGARAGPRRRFCRPPGRRDRRRRRRATARPSL
ncbi:MAG: hypothetical protein AVDCRST_MAG69-1602, partial [uncultured Solirubrobacteraceae bacterium]